MGVNLSKVEKKTKNYSHVLLVMRHAKAEPFNDKGDHDRGMSTASVVVFGSDQPFSRWQVHDAELLAVLSPKDFD